MIGASRPVPVDVLDKGICMTSPLRSMTLPVPSRYGAIATLPARSLTNAAQTEGDTFCFGRYRLLVRERLLLKDDVPVRVGSRAFDLLLVLVERAGQTIARQELFERVWPDVIVAKVNLRVHVAGLRKALGDGRDGNRFIVSVAGRGYSFVAPVRRLDFAADAAGLSRLARSPPPTFLQHMFVCFVDLAGLDDPAHVTMAVAAALGYEVEPQQAPICVLSCLKDKKLLLVFDNCERVLAGIAQLAAQLFAEAPHVQVLISSQIAPPI